MLRDDVAILLAEHGKTMTVTRIASSTYNPATGVMSAGTTQTYTIRGVFINYNEEQINGTTIRADDRKLLIQAKGLTATPQIGDRVEGVEILTVRRLESAATTIAFTCQTRG